jgi:NADPH:quinone reductase
MTMRALAFLRAAADTSATTVLDLPVPEPAVGQVTIDVRYAGVNFKDVMARRGDTAYVSSWPHVPGIGVAGTVRALGPGVTDLAVGQRVAAVTTTGGLAEVAVAPAALTVAVPAAMDLAVAAAATDAPTAAALLVEDVARVRAGDVVLLHTAAGGIGQALAPLARLAGARLLLGTVGDQRRVQAAIRAGYDEVFVRGAGLGKDVLDRTSGAGVDVVFDPTGTQQLAADLEMVAPLGRIVLFGNATGEPFGDPPPVGGLIRGNVAVAGFSLAALSAGSQGRVAAALRLVLEHLAAGRLPMDITLVDALDRAPEAQQRLAEGRGEGKYIVRVA